MYFKKKKLLDYNLFSIETNKVPKKKNIYKTDHYLKIINHFGIKSRFSILKIEKKNPYSEIFLVKTKKNFYALRSVNTNLKNQLENQCQIIKKTHGNLFIRPISVNEKYSVLINNKCWIMYEWIEGKIYNGDFSLINSILIHSINLQNQFLNLNEININNLKKIYYNPLKWNNIWRWIFGKTINKNHLVLKKRISKKLKKFLLIFKNNFFTAINNSQNLKIKYQIVHYDLQHANIIVTKNKKIKFIDIEDICLSDLRLTIFHGLFKLIRHSIYKKKVSVKLAVSWIKKDSLKIINRKFSSNYNLFDIAKYSEFRMLSDIYNIFFEIIYKGKFELIYDLEKKIQNLLECFVIFNKINEKNKI